MLAFLVLYDFQPWFVDNSELDLHSCLLKLAEVLLVNRYLQLSYNSTAHLRINAKLSTQAEEKYRGHKVSNARQAWLPQLNA